MAGPELTQLFLLVGTGVICGFFSSTPLGVINLWVVDAALAKREHTMKAFVAGVIVADIAYAAIAAWGFHAFLSEGPFGRWLELVGGGFLVVVGGLNLWKARASSATGATKAVPAVLGGGLGTKKIRDFALGAFLCGSNPAFLMFWLFCIKKIEEYEHILLTDANVYAFLGGIGLGDALWFHLLTKVVHRGQKAVRPKALNVISSVIAVLFVAAGLAAVVKAF